MELRSKTLSSVNKHEYYYRKLNTFIKNTIMLTDKNLQIKRMTIIIKWMIYHSKYYWMYIDTCGLLIKKTNMLKCLSIMYQKTFILQKEINECSLNEIIYYNEKNFRNKCLTYRLLYEKKFETIFSEKIPLDVLRYILLFI